MLKKISFKDKEKIIRSALKRVNSLLPKSDFISSSPSPFVGRFNYPDINLGILTTPQLNEYAWVNDAPVFWSSENFKIPDIVNLRTELINSNFRVNVKKIDSLVSSVQDIALSKVPVDVNIKVDKSPRILFKSDSLMAPTGASAKLKSFSLESTPNIPGVVQKFYYDKDCNAVEAVTSLFNKGFDETSLTRMLSVGSFGVEKNRKLVPTRWSITATDDILGKDLIKSVKNFSENSDFLVYKGVYLGNFYFVLFFPGQWQYELFECYVNSKEFSSDFENFSGRKDYASSCAGGYYSVRLTVLEKLKELKRQSSVLVLRFISDDYFLPLGVWVTREASRKALKSNPIRFSDKRLLLDFIKSVAKNNFSVDVSLFFRLSKLLSQKRLFDF
jgi:DNA repair protein NreA